MRVVCSLEIFLDGFVRFAWLSLRPDSLVRSFAFMHSQSKVCRNCGGTEFYSKAMAFSGYVRPMFPIGFFGEDTGRVRICGGCGLVEWFVSTRTLEDVKERFARDE